MKKYLLLIAVGIFTLNSCEREDKIEDNSLEMNYSAKSNKIEAMKEFAQLLGKTLSDKENRKYLVDLIHQRGDNSEAVTANALLGKNISKEELLLLSRNKNNIKISAKESFKKTLINEVRKNIDQYPNLKSQLKKINASTTQRTIEDTYDELSEYYASQGLDVYFPYEENFNLEDENTITLTWDPMIEQNYNSGYQSVNGIYGLQPIAIINDDFAYNNPVLVVRPAVYIESAIASDPNPNPVIISNNPPNWAFQGWQGFLNFNVDHTKIMDADVLKVNIPKIRLMEHLGTFLTPTTITLVRSSANLTTDNNNNLVFPLSADSRQLITQQHIKRRDARNHNWVDVNILWDDDWNMHEAEHTLTWASHHTFSGNLNAKGTVKLGWDVEKKKVTFDPKIDINFDVRVGGNCKLRYNNNVSRRAVLTQIIGDTGAGTYNDNGTEYSVRAADKLQYYFKPYLTKIVQ